MPAGTDAWRVHVCEECGELYVYPGICDNRSKHGDPLKHIVLTTITVKRVPDQNPDSLPELQQHEGLPPQGEGESE